MKGDKKYTATIGGKTRSFGAKGYSISPGTIIAPVPPALRNVPILPAPMTSHGKPGAAWEKNLWLRKL